MKQKQLSTPIKEEQNAKILFPAGSILSNLGYKKVPSFFNVAQLQNIQADIPPIIIFGSRLKKGEKLNLKMIAFIEFQKDSLVNRFIIGNNISDEHVDIESTDYMGFSVNDLDLKNLFEHWIKANCDLGSCNNFRWYNEFQTKSMLKGAVIKELDN